MFSKTIQLYKDALTGLSRPVWLLTVVMFINRMGAMVLPFVTIYLTDTLGFSLTDAGMVMTCYGLGSLVGVYLGGKLTDHFGPWRVQVSSLFLTGIGFFVLMHITTFIGFCIIYFMISLVADIFRPANMALMGTLALPENRTRSMSLIRLAINLGYAGGTAFGGFIALHLGYGSLFIIDGMTCLFAGLFFIGFIPRPKAYTKEEKVANIQARKAEKSPYRDADFLWFALMVFLTALTFMQLLTTLPLYLKEVHILNEGEIGLLMSLNCIILVLIELPIIHYFERSGINKLKMCAYGAFLILLSHVLFVIPDIGIWAVWTYFILVTFGEMINFPFTNAHALDVSPPTNIGAYMGLYGIMWSMAFMIAPIMGTHLAEAYGWEIMWLVVSGVGSIATLGYWWLYRRMRAKVYLEAVAG